MPTSFDHRMRGPSSTKRTAAALLVFAALFGADRAVAKPSVEDMLAYQTPPTLSGSYLAARYAGGQHDVTAAADYFRNVLALDPTNAPLADRTFQLLLADGRVAEAVDRWLRGDARACNFD